MVFRRLPLDLNYLPDDDQFIRDHSKQPLDNSSSSAASFLGVSRKKKNSSKDERWRVYECRFCSLKFRKSQALGGHMNRHRQEREAETLNQARQLVFSTDNMLTPPPHQLGGQPTVHGGYHYAAGYNMGGVAYPTRLLSGTILPPPPHLHTYTSQLTNVYFLGPYVSNT